MTTARLYSLVQIAKQRKCGFYYVHLINTDGTIKKRRRSLIVRFPSHLGAVPVGSLWKVTGQQSVSQFMMNGYLVYEDILDATHATMVQPVKHTLSRWISLNIDGIGEVIANRLVRQRSLEKWVRSADVAALCEVPGMNSKLAQRLIAQWPEEGLYQTMDWLDGLGLSPSLGFKLVRLFGSNAVDRLTENPFLLLGLDVAYDQVVTIIDQLKLNLSEETLAAGAAMHVVIKHANRSGSTVLDGQALKQAVNALTSSLEAVDPGQAAVKQGLLVRVQDGYQTWGAALMEATVARKLTACLNRPAGQGALLAGWECPINKRVLQNALTTYEKTLPFTLSGEQREAVLGALSAPVVGISGGAGTGKTTILKAIIGLYEQLSSGLALFPVALSGRAARRMSDSIGRPAFTIAKLIMDHLGEGKPRMPDHVLIVIDEASMVDLLSMYRLVGMLPEATRFIFLGDIAQLPPVGNGLVFHVLHNSPIPFHALSEVRRQSEQSPVHRFASAVRQGQVVIPENAAPALSESSACCMISPPCLDRLTALWGQAGAHDDRIILSPRRSGEWGVVSLNHHFQRVQGADRPDIHYLDPTRGWIPWITRDNQRIKEGDPILITQNIYDDECDVRNGDLGVVTEVFDTVTTEGWYGMALVNGAPQPINQDLLEVLDLSYAITIHKAQGSEWRTVFSVVTRDARHMLEASMLYTAATRPTERLVLVTDTLSLQDAVKAGNSASQKRVDLGNKLFRLASTGQKATA